MTPPEPSGTAKSVWIVNPYGTLPGEAWATYRSTMLAHCLVESGYEVTQFISNFEHRSKTFRSPDHRVLTPRPGYRIEVIPSTSYRRHISLERIRYERLFGKNLRRLVGSRARPAFVVLAEPALFYYDTILSPLLADGASKLVLDLIDTWPELFEVAVPRPARPFARLAFAPLYRWRRRLYRRASAVVAVARTYARLAERLVVPGTPVQVVYWGHADEPRQSAAPNTDLDRLVATRPSGEVWAVYAGTLGENYDIRALVQTARRLEKEPGANIRIVVCGDGPLAEFCREHAGRALTFLGRLAPAHLAELYTHCQIALSTYKGESTVAMPIKAFDYFRAGLPIVNSLGGDLGALIHEHGVGLNYTPSDVRGLHTAVTALATDRAMRERMAANATTLGREFGADRQYPRFVSLLEQLSRS